MAAIQLNPAPMPLFRLAVQGLLISELSLDPAKLIAGLQMSILILQGERDLQVGSADARRLASANQEARPALLPDVNHVLKRVRTSSRANKLTTYRAPTLPLASEATDQIAAFISAHAVVLK